MPPFDELQSLILLNTFTYLTIDYTDANIVFFIRRRFNDTNDPDNDRRFE